MKKTWLLPLLLVGLMAGCANEGTDGGNGGNGGNDAGNETTSILGADPTVANATQVGKFDLTGITGTYVKGTPGDGIHFSGDFANLFVNSVSNGVGIATATANEKVEKGQLEQGPCIGGVKMNSDSEKEKFGQLDLTFEAGKSVDTVVFRIRSWKAETFIINVNEEDFTNEGNETDYIDVVYEADDTTSLTIKSLNQPKYEGKTFGPRNRFTICGLYLYNK